MRGDWDERELVGSHGSVVTLRRGPLIGRRYRIGRTIGRGGTSMVYAAEHVTTEQGVAIKVLSNDEGDELQARGGRARQRAAQARRNVPAAGSFTTPGNAST